MVVKYSMTNDAAEETIPIIAKPQTLSAKYKSCLPITKTKYNDLKKLCDTDAIPKIFHGEYLNFPTCIGRDVLIDTDIEDDVDDNDLQILCNNSYEKFARELSAVILKKYGRGLHSTRAWTIDFDCFL